MGKRLYAYEDDGVKVIEIDDMDNKTVIPDGAVVTTKGKLKKIRNKRHYWEIQGDQVVVNLNRNISDGDRIEAIMEEIPTKDEVMVELLTWIKDESNAPASLRDVAERYVESATEIKQIQEGI